jgi:hypothetical protein
MRDRFHWTRLLAYVTAYGQNRPDRTDRQKYHAKRRKALEEAMTGRGYSGRMSAPQQLTEQQRNRLQTAHYSLPRREMVRYWLLSADDIRRINEGVRTGYGQNWYIEQRLARQARASPDVSTKRSSGVANMLFAECGFGPLPKY